jgi:hypothetical protein
MARDKKKCIIVDVNKTILKDKVSPIQPVIDYVNNKFDEGYKVFLISGSHSARLRVMRIALARCGVKYHDLTLNDEGILLDGEYKRKYVRKQMQYYDVVQFIDNNEQHRDAVASLGVDVSAPDQISS